MTQDIETGSRDRLAKKDGEFEVTPEMIEAEEDVLACELGGGVFCQWRPDEVARRVYLAMARLAPHQNQVRSRNHEAR